MVAPETTTHNRDDARGRIPVLLVAYGTGPMSDAQLHLACRSANDVGAMVRVLHVIERSRHVPLSVPLSAEEHARADALLDRAEAIARSYGVLCQLEAHVARSVGEAIVADAAEHHAEAIFIGLRDRNRPGTSLLVSATLRAVLQKATCPVQIGYLPASLPDDVALDAPGIARFATTGGKIAPMAGLAGHESNEAPAPLAPGHRGDVDYAPLQQFLRSYAPAVAIIPFGGIEQVLGQPLPAAAREQAAWWSNDRTRAQANAWLDGGYEVTGVDVERHIVTFTRRSDTP